MYEQTCYDLTMECYENMPESSLNLDTITSEVNNVTPEIIEEILGVPNSGITLRESRTEEKPHSEYDKEFGIPKE